MIQITFKLGHQTLSTIAGDSISHVRWSFYLQHWSKGAVLPRAHLIDMQVRKVH